MRNLTILALFGSTLLGGCVSQSQYLKVQQENQKLKDRIEKMDARADAQLAAFKELLADMKPLIDKGVLKVEVVDGRITLGVASDILFSSGSADLSAGGKDTLAEVARLLANKVGDRDFQVEGHTDDQPINTAAFPDNWHLGAARSITVTEFMIAHGFPEDHISAATFADNEPVASNSNETGRARNRRIEIVLLPDLADLPGYKRLMAEQNARPRERKNKGK
jgi:chemotaxis protein MotB